MPAPSYQCRFAGDTDWTAVDAYFDEAVRLFVFGREDLFRDGETRDVEVRRFGLTAVTVYSITATRRFEFQLKALVGAPDPAAAPDGPRNRYGETPADAAVMDRALDRHFAARAAAEAPVVPGIAGLAES
jgi:hypothetical protein